MGLVKAEILWTRVCPLRCSFCSMPNDITARAPVEKMIDGLYRLKELGCGFIAIYGASPLSDFEGLPDYIHAAEKIGILTTVITDGIAKNHKEKLQQLYDAGMRSLTCSYDFVPYDVSSRTKSNKGYELARWFATLPDIRDVEIVSTVTNQNFTAIIETLPRILNIISHEKAWFSFDIVHPDRGQPGTKCRGNAKELRLSSDELRLFASAMLQEKEMGVHIHQSTNVLKWMRDHPAVASNFEWNCAREKSFPAWLTIDADGSVLPCDDFHITRNVKVWELNEFVLDELSKEFSQQVQTHCPGCAWTTHYDALAIKDGSHTFSQYVHQGVV